MATKVGCWVDSSAYEFLGLSPEESAYVDLKLRLSDALRRYRVVRPMSQVALAKLIKSSQSRVAKMENGDPSVTIDLLLRALIRLGVKREEIASVLTFDEPKPAWITGTSGYAQTDTILHIDAKTPTWYVPGSATGKYRGQPTKAEIEIIGVTSHMHAPLPVPTNLKGGTA